jgi:hypothetical protein
MYRQGHGDCFLLTFRGSEGGPVFVLIDCGFKPGSNDPEYGLRSIEAIVEDIRKATGGRIDLVIVTHEHQDHVNGFWKEQDPYFKDFDIGAAWFAWTEDPEDNLANELRQRHGDQLLGLVAARNRLLDAGAGPAAERLGEFLSFELGGRPQDIVAALKKQKDPSGSANKQAMKLIKDKAGKRNTRYIRPHDEILHIPNVEGVRVFALGPPRRANLLADTDPRESEAFPGHGARARSSFFAAVDGDATSDIQPFARRFALPLRNAFTDPEHGDFFTERYGHPQLPDGERAEDTAWRRIDSDWLYSAEALALALNKGINNTSLVLAFELQRSGKVLLFVGDAQRGNWMSWTDGSWRDGDEEVTVRDLLSRTVLYKVGHHGSHNATLTGTSEDAYPNLAWMGRGRYASEFTAMITAVNKWALGVKPIPWRHPLPSIKRALEEKCAGRVLQTDTRKLPTRETPDGDWDDFLERLRVDSGDLYFDYEIPDRQP